MCVFFAHNIFSWFVWVIFGFMLKCFNKEPLKNHFKLKNQFSFGWNYMTVLERHFSSENGRWMVAFSFFREELSLCEPYHSISIWGRTPFLHYETPPDESQISWWGTPGNTSTLACCTQVYNDVQRSLHSFSFIEKHVLCIGPTPSMSLTRQMHKCLAIPL